MIIERKSEKSASEKSYLQYFVFQVNYCNTKIHLFSQKNRTEMDEYVLFLSVHLIQQISHQNELLFSHLVTSNSLHPIDCNTPGFPVLHHLPEPAQTHVHGVSDAIQLSRHLWSSSLPVFNLSQHQGLFQWARSSHQVANVLELQISPSNEYSGLISFRSDWLDLAVQGILKSLL